MSDVSSKPNPRAQLSSSASKQQLLELRTGVLRTTPLMLTILGCAIYRRPSCVDVCRLLLQHGARVDAKDVCGKTALHYICGMVCIGQLSNQMRSMRCFRQPFINSCFIIQGFYTIYLQAPS